MTYLKNILFPTDFSEISENAMPYAIDIQKKNKGKLSMLNVHDLPLMAPANAFSTREATMMSVAEEMQILALDKLKEIDEFKLSGNYLVERGGAKEEIIKAIEENEIDLVVMGTKGETSEKGFLMSSVTKEVIQNSSCPVLAIPEKAIFKKISKIVYATNLQHDESNLMKYLIEFAKLYNATIVVLHVDNDASVKEWSIELLQEFVEKIDYSKVEYQELIGKDIAKEISAFVDENNVDMLAVTTYSTTLFEKIFRKSFTKELLFHTQIPLLAFNRKKYDAIFLS